MISSSGFDNPTIQAGFLRIQDIPNVEWVSLRNILFLFSFMSFPSTLLPCVVLGMSTPTSLWKEHWRHARCPKEPGRVKSDQRKRLLKTILNIFGPIRSMRLKLCHAVLLFQGLWEKLSGSNVVDTSCTPLCPPTALHQCRSLFTADFFFQIFLSSCGEVGSFSVASETNHPKKKSSSLIAMYLHMFGSRAPWGSLLADSQAWIKRNNWKNHYHLMMDGQWHLLCSNLWSNSAI